MLYLPVQFCHLSTALLTITNQSLIHHVLTHRPHTVAKNHNKAPTGFEAVVNTLVNKLHQYFSKENPTTAAGTIRTACKHLGSSKKNLSLRFCPL
jgi:hypothetical protein